MRVTIITGTSQGLGRELMDQLMPEADRLISINRRSTDNPDEILCDLGSRDDVVKATNDLAQKLSQKTDVLFVLNAGEYGDDEAISDVTPEALAKIMYINVFSQLILVESLIKAGHKVRVIAISSGMGSIAEVRELTHFAYSASKSSLNLCVRLLQKQHSELDYMIVDPGWMQTRMGGAGARLDPARTVKFIAEAIDESTKWNIGTGMISAETGEVIPW